jgi:hypothetical protein
MRQHERYETRIDCRLSAPEGAELACVIKDISRGGVGLEALLWRGWSDFQIRFLVGDSAHEFPCEARNVQVLWDHYVIHAQFGALSGDQRQELDDVIEFVRGQPPIHHSRVNLGKSSFVQLFHRPRWWSGGSRNG